MTDVEALEMTYLDTFSLFRKEKVKNEDTGIAETVEIEVYSNKKCALSKNNLTNIMQTDGVGNLVESYTFFTNPSLGIKAGDKLVIESMSGTDTFKVSSKSFKYSSHQELTLLYKDRV